MPIPYLTIQSGMASQLDAEGSDRYTFLQDYMPATNYAVRFSVSVFNRAFAKNKLSPEILRELNVCRVWQLNDYQRFSFDPADTGHNLWSVIAIYPNITTNKKMVGVLQGTPEKSFFRSDLSYISTDDDSLKRLSHEEWNTNKKNIFVQGNDVNSVSFNSGAYLDITDFTSTSYSLSVPGEISVRYKQKNKLVAMVYLKSPKVITTTNDILEFPDTMTDFITEMALRYIANKQGDNTTLYAVTDKDVNTLAALFS